MNAKNKALTIVSFVIVCLFVFFLYEGISEYNKSLNVLLTKEARHIDTIVDDINHFSLETYLIRIRHIEEEHPDLVRTFAQRDRNRLYNLALHEYSILREENEYFQAFNFNLPDGTVLLRVQQPSISGTDISESHEIIDYVQETRETIAGYDIGGSGAVYRIAHPVFYNGEYIGAMEFGISVNQILDAIGKRLNTSVSSILHVNRNDGFPEMDIDFRMLGHHALLNQSDEPVFARIPRDFDFDHQYQRLKIDGRIFLVHSNSVLEDFAGRGIGHIVVLQDITANILKKRDFIIRTVIIALFLLGVVFSVIWITMSGLIARLESSVKENREARDNLQVAHSQLEKRVEERTAELAAANDSLLKEIAERQQAETHLSEQHAFLNNILESLTTPFYVIDADTYAIVLANEAAYALSDRPREGLTCYQLTHNQEKPCSGDKHTCALEMVRKTGKLVKVEHIHCGREGEGRNFEVYAYPIFDREGRVKQVIEYNIDITERRKAEEEKKEIWNQLLQSQKMEAIGILAGGVAHDFNNVLTAIIGNVQLAMVKGGDCRERVGKYLDQIMKSSNRAVSLVRQLLLFSRREGIEELAPLDLNGTVENILKMLSRLIGEDVEIKTSLAPDLWTVKADKINLEQVITNLVVNARDAMPDGGEIMISTKNLGIDETLEKQIDQARLGDFVVLSVADTGQGMGERELEKIFEPFYTTKKAGQGTGLGLSIVRGVAEQHGGWINVYSEENKGTIFNIYLPAAMEEELVANEAAIPENILSRGAFGRGLRVLIVEDETDIGNLAIQILEGMGFIVLVAEDCEQARNIMENETNDIDLLFSDVTLPDGNGVDLAQEFLERQPELKILMTSGYPDQRSRLSIIRERKMRFILKPYGLAELEEMLWEIIHHPSNPSAS